MGMNIFLIARNRLLFNTFFVEIEGLSYQSKLDQIEKSFLDKLVFLCGGALGDSKAPTPDFI
jgi:hypothetical protein